MKKIRTRKKKTLLGCLVLLLLLAIAMGTHLMGVTPGQNIRAVENLVGLAPTEPVMDRDDLYLTENQDVLLLTAYDPGCWRDRWGNNTLNFVAMDKYPDAPAIGGGYWNREFAQSTLHLLGEVFLEEAVSVRAYCQASPYNQHPTVELTAEVFTAPNGSRCFWSVTQLETKEIDTLPYTMDLLDQDGNILYTCDISSNWTGEG